MERVATIMMNYMVDYHQCKVGAVLLSRQVRFHSLNERVEVFEPPASLLAKNAALRYSRLSLFVRASIRRFRPFGVIGFGESYNSFTIVCSLGLGIPVVVSNRASPMSSLRGFRGAVNPLVYPLAKSVVVPSARSIDILRSRYRFVRFNHIPNPFIVETENRPMKSRDKVIINVGNLGGQKNQGLLIRYFSRLRGLESWRVFLVGEGPNHGELAKMIADLGLEGRVCLLGTRSDVPDLLKNAQIFAFTSTSEGFPNALGEAMAAGCACLSFDCVTGPEELIKDGDDGLLVPVGDHARYQEALGMLAGDVTLRTRLGEAARSKVAADYSVGRICSEYLGLLLG